MNWKWAEPSALNLIIIVLILGASWLWTQRYHLKQFKTLAHPRAVDFLLSQVNWSRVRIKQLAAIFGLCFLVLGLMRLQSPGGTIEIRSEGIEVILLADVSESMLAEDLRPNRLGQMKYDFMRFIDLIGGHHVGLVAFARSAHLLSPLTNDPSALKMYLDSLSPLSVSSQGTNIANAIEVAIAAFERGGKIEQEDSKVTRAILIATDGEDHEPQAMEQVKKLLSDKGVRVFTLAYGSAEGAKIPVRDSLGYLRGSKIDRSGNEVLTKVNTEFLQQLAEAGGGEFKVAEAGSDHMKRFVEAFNQLEKRVNNTEAAITYKEHYMIFGWLSLILLLVYKLLPLRKPPSRYWLGRLLSILVVFVSLSAEAEIKTLSGWYHYQLAQKHLQKSNHRQALESLRQALKHEPFSSEVQIGLGTIYANTEQWDKALSSFKLAEELATDPAEQFAARYNQGVLHQSQKRPDEALSAYLSALEVQPLSKETKINIELLIQQMQQEGEGEGQGEGEGEGDGDQNKDQEPQSYQESKPQPKQFRSEELSEADMKRILDELRNQEQKIRSEFNKQEQKERPSGKDW